MAFFGEGEGHSHAGGFISGLTHPILGFDHLLAMISVGMLSTQIGGKAIWTVPSTFVLVMLLGGILGINGVPIPFVETGIAFSVVALGLAMAAGSKIPVIYSMIFVSIFAIFHGHAHGVEMPHVANPYMYALGFATGTAGIHVAGVWVGMAADMIPKGDVVLKVGGVIIAIIGALMLAGVELL